MPATPAIRSQLFTLVTDSTDGWAPLAKVGTYPNTIEREGEPARKVQQALTAEALAQLAASPIPEGGILIDYDHASFDPDGSTEAGGWIDELRITVATLEMKVRWSAGGRAKLEGGDFRLISPSWDFSETSPGTITPTKLIGAGLTNRPNLTNLPPLSNRAPLSPPQKMNPELLALLGLAATATDADVLAAVKALKDGSASATTAMNAAKADATAAHNRATSLLNELVEKDLTEFSGVIHNRDTTKAALLKDRDGARSFLSGLKAPEPAAPIHNRRQTGQPVPITADKSSMQTSKVKAYQAANPNVSFTDAWNACRSADPALFA